MGRIAFVYGSIAGAVIVASWVLGMAVDSAEWVALEWLGYLIMLVALSLVFIGVKRYRDEELGGVIRFRTAATVGLAITLVASVIYVVAWEVTLNVTDFSFMEEYAQATVEARREAGATEAELAEVREEMAAMSEQYRRTPYRLGITFLEIFPVGLLVTLASAALLRRPEVLPS